MYFLEAVMKHAVGVLFALILISGVKNLPVHSSNLVNFAILFPVPHCASSVLLLYSILYFIFYNRVKV
jgi:hypothetical protein